MRRLSPFLILLLTGLASAQQEKTLRDDWSQIRINGSKSGWSRETRRTVQEGGGEIVRTEISTEMRMKRGRDEIKIAEDSAFDETPEGTPIRFRYKSVMSANATVHVGEIKGDTVEVTVSVGKTEEKKTYPWKREYLSPLQAERLAKEKGLEPGTEYSYEQFVPQYGKGATAKVKVIGKEKTKIGKEEVELVKTETTMSLMPGVVTTIWADSDCRPVKTSMKMMGIEFVTEKADRATALLSETGDLPEIMIQSLLRPKRKLSDPRKVTKATYRLIVKEGEVDPKGLAYDGQTVDKVEDRAIMITVDPPRAQGEVPLLPIDDPKLAGFLEETVYLQCKDAKVVAAAKEAVGDEKVSWAAAKKIEKWVSEHIKKKNFGVAFASAKEVAERLEGDCTEHAVLAAAMARAVGIPSRLAVGLASVQDIFGGHMWAEVWVGKWVAIDAALPSDPFDATHIKMGESAGSGADLANGFVDVLLYIGKIELEIVEATEK